VSLQDLIQAQAQREEFQELLRFNAEATLEFYLGESLEYDVPDIHVTIWGLLINTALDKVLLAIPRGHAKTTLAKLSVVHYFYYTDRRFCVYLSNTNPIAKNACRDIMAYMDSDNHKAVFGEVELIKASETDSIWIFQIVDVNGRKKRCILRAMGVGQQVRGLNIDNERPDILVGDDVEDRENTATPLLQKNLDDWVFGTLLKALGRTTKIIWIGNIIRKTGLLARLSLDPEWNPVVFGSLVQGDDGAIRPLWPDLWPLTALIKDFKTYSDNGQTETWMCEMMNMPGYGKNGFRIDQVRYRALPSPESVVASFITVDPAFGLNKGVNDKSAVVVHVLDDENVPMVVGYVHEHLTETQIFDACLMFAEVWNAWVWGIEAIAAQSVLLTLFDFILASRGMQGAVELVELYAGRGDPKAGRIQAWVNMMGENQYYLFDSDVEATAQLLAYDKSKKNQADDLIDACAYGPQMLNRYSGLISEMATRPRGQIGHNSGLYGIGLTHV
jgi:hypothetical protein